MSKMTAHEWEIAYGQLEDEHKATLSRIERAIAENKLLWTIIEEALLDILLDIGSMELTEFPQTDQIAIRMMRLRLEQSLESKKLEGA